MGIRLYALPKAIAELVARITAVEQLLAARTQGTGTITAALAVGGLGPVTVRFTKAMPDADYSVIGVALEGVAGISGVLVPVLPITNPTTAGCTVQVKNNGVVALGAGATVRVTVAKL